MSWSPPETVPWRCEASGLELVLLTLECAVSKGPIPPGAGSAVALPSCSSSWGFRHCELVCVPPPTRERKASPASFRAGVIRDCPWLGKACVTFQVTVVGGTLDWPAMTLASCLDFFSHFLFRGLVFPTVKWGLWGGPSPRSLPAMAFLHPPGSRDGGGGGLEGAGDEPGGSGPTFEFECVHNRMLSLNGPRAPSQPTFLFLPVVFLFS